jgi:hypothetical protein
VNQFLGTHAVNAFLYQGTSKVTGAVSTTAQLGTNTGAAAQYIDQPFTTAAAQTTVTRVDLTATLVSTGADTTVGIYADNGSGKPTGAALASCFLPLDFIPASAGVISIPFGLTGLVAATMYHIVINGTASTTLYETFSEGATVTNAAQTSPTGVGGTWTTAGKTLVFVVWAGNNGVLRNTLEDSGARWTGLDYAQNASFPNSGPPTTIKEFTIGTTNARGLRSLRTLAYTAGILTSVS